MFVDDDGSPEMIWLVAEGRSAFEAACLVNDCIGFGGDGFSVSLVYGVIEPNAHDLGDRRFRKVEPDEAAQTVPMWEVELG